MNSAQCTDISRSCINVSEPTSFEMHLKVNQLTAKTDKNLQKHVTVFFSADFYQMGFPYRKNSSAYHFLICATIAHPSTGSECYRPGTTLKPSSFDTPHCSASVELCLASGLRPSVRLT